MMYKLYDYSKERREYTSNGIQYIHLATVLMGGKKYIVYEVVSTKEKYIEELISTKVSDIILGEDQLIYIKDNSIWQQLVVILQKENII